ncbi:MAG TPA: hydrogenase maturation nickel metallochaperone HypA [Verrucomicrobiae bacterium]|jgi:hydrogenase nickel incorporation protein HypA/HybF|nr:hydrogenase maturation nickel metallochaperone HypA [Verrucomicrobiae bacterium]
MHEFSLATQIMESVLEFAQAHGAAEVTKVRLRVGELACVEAEQLRFCFHSITRETPLEKAVLEIEPFAATVHCLHCNYQGPPKYWEGAIAGTSIPTLQCPRCTRGAEALSGHECEIKSVQFVNSPSEASV